MALLRRLGCLVLVVAALLAVVLAGNFFWGWNASGPLDEDTAIVISSGTSLSAAAEQMEEAGIVRSAEAFLTRAKLLGSDEPIKAGEFSIPAGASNATILSILQGNDVIERLITIPEGTPSVIVHDILMAEESLTGEIPVPAEGSVLPESYAYQRGEPRAAVLIRMQQAMTETLAELWENRSDRTVVTSPEEAVTLAAIVEKETGQPSERATIAGVYSNRIRRGMMLQADPTIIYPMTRGRPLGRRIRQSEIAAVNDYNTYTMVGLPRGPITNPGRQAIAAVLNPAETDALYFVASGDGGHVFAETFAEHQANVERWYAIRRERGEME